CSRQQSNFDYW
nr:immunoglobulin heavy chain junction region [Macaca mulatta]